MRPERAKAPSPGQRPGKKQRRKTPCKGKSIIIVQGVKLLPLQGALTPSHIPRALPWARCFLGFQPAFIPV